MSVRRAALVLLLGACACDGGAGAQAGADPIALAALRDPAACKGCHAQHYREWASSMHAYAARDPVFIAMNERGQIETDGELGDFCVKCHAPMALELGLTKDGLNLPELDDPDTRGVTCYFCHSAEAVNGDHNRALHIAQDGVMHGGLGAGEHAIDPRNAAPPQPNRAHGSAYSALHDATRRASAALCGACHDVINRAGVALERTFAEWRSSRFASEDAGALRTCAACHMATYAGRAAPTAPERTLHRHLWPGVDVALEPHFPGARAQTAAIACAFEHGLALDLAPAASARALEQVDVSVTNSGVGHAWPSGAAQDRRAWIELIAYDAAGRAVFERGAIEPGEIVGAREPELEVFRDRLFDAGAQPVHMFWQAARSPAHALGYESNHVPAPGEGSSAAARTSRYTLPTTAVRVHARLRLQSIGLDVLDDFRDIVLPISERVISHGYQEDPTLRSRVPTITVAERELVLGENGARLSTPAPSDAGCDAQSYVSLLDD